MDLNKIKNVAHIVTEAGAKMMVMDTADVCELVDLVERQEKELAGARFAVQSHQNTVELQAAIIDGQQRATPASPASAPEASDDDLLDVVRTLCSIAARMRELPDEKREYYPSPTCEGSPLLLAAQQACLARGYTADGLSTDANPVAAPLPPVVARKDEEDNDDLTTKQGKLFALADRIDHEKLWRMAGMDHHKLTADQKDRMNAAVALRRYADIWTPGHWVVVPPTGGIQFGASTLEKAVAMAKKHLKPDAARLAGKAEGSE